MDLGFRSVESNLRKAMHFFGMANGAGEVQRSDGLDLIYSGLDYGVFNIALLAQPVPSERDLSNLVAAAGRWYRDRKSRWSFWICEDLLDPSARRHSREIFAEAGLRPISHAPGMVAPALAPPTRPLPRIECRAVADLETRSAFAGLTMSCFDIPGVIARAVYEPERAWQGAYRGYVWIVNGLPVAIVALVRAEGVVGIYSLGTMPGFRHKGYGEALLRAAIEQDKAGASGNEPYVLESTDAGYNLYRRLGFRDVTNFSVYLLK
jgi:ribosomal protein S18 acetylase RimI-like enzyme